ncbi:MAG: response regulator transcription factor [Nonlabens sp.]
MSRTYNIIVADDHPMLLAGTSALLDSLAYQVVQGCKNGQLAYNAILKLQPDLAILDVDMPVMTGLEVAAAVKRNKIDCKIILLTMHKRRELVQEVGNLLDGYLIKEDTAVEIDRAISTVMDGGNYVSSQLSKGLYDTGSPDYIKLLTPTEVKVLKTMARLQTSRLVAQELLISPRTVERHRSNIIKKLELGKGQNALLIWLQQHPEIATT